MEHALRFEYPPEVVRQRDQLYKQILALLAENTLESVREAVRLHSFWLNKYPEDYVALDTGEVLSMSLSALLAAEPQPALASAR